jgi:hypothetical protein
MFKIENQFLQDRNKSSKNVQNTLRDQMAIQDRSHVSQALFVIPGFALVCSIRIGQNSTGHVLMAVDVG